MPGHPGRGESDERRSSEPQAGAGAAGGLFAVDEDPGTVHALRDDLSRRFGQEFGIVCESSADAGLAALRELAVRRVPVALLIVGLGESRHVVK